MGRTIATQPATAGKLRPSPAPADARPKEGYRDTVEAIVVAFILALVVRGFEAQAFVIPTGSMAPTLMGRHKEVSCPQCGFVYAVNASQEVESQSMREDVDSGICSNCRYQARLEQTPSFKGDRILVMMFPYDLPFLPGSGPPRPLGRRRVPVSRRARAQLHQATGRPAGRDDPDRPWRRLHQAARGRHIHPGPEAVAAPGRDACMNVYDDRNQPRALADSKRLAAMAERRRLEASRTRLQPLRSGRGRQASPGTSCGTITWFRMPSNGTRS